MSHLSITSIYLMEKYVFLMILLEKNIFLKICHTIASGTDLRKTPQHLRCRTSEFGLFFNRLLCNFRLNTIKGLNGLTRLNGLTGLNGSKRLNRLTRLNWLTGLNRFTWFNGVTRLMG